MNEQSSQIILRLSFSRILVLILVVLPIISHAGDGDDLVKAAATGNLSKVRTLLEKETNVDHPVKMVTAYNSIPADSDFS